MKSECQLVQPEQQGQSDQSKKRRYNKRRTTCLFFRIIESRSECTYFFSGKRREVFFGSILCFKRSKKAGFDLNHGKEFRIKSFFTRFGRLRRSRRKHLPLQCCQATG